MLICFFHIRSRLNFNLYLLKLYLNWAVKLCFNDFPLICDKIPNKLGRVSFGSLFKGSVHHGKEGVEGGQDRCHIESAVEKLTETMLWCPVDSVLFIQSWTPGGVAHSKSRYFHLTNVSRDVSPRWVQGLSPRDASLLLVLLLFL